MIPEIGVEVLERPPCQVHPSRRYGLVLGAEPLEDLGLEDEIVQDSLDEGRRQRLHARRFEGANLLELRHGAS